MKQHKYFIPTLLASGLAALSLASPLTMAGEITLMQLQDVHGHIHPHAEIFPDGRKDPESGGLAKLTTLISQVRADYPDNLLLAIGDTTHGSTETTFSLGDVLMPWLNSLGIDAFTPGNWDFGYGPRVYRQRFTPNTAIQLAPNNRTTIAWMDGVLGNKCNVPGPLNATTYASCHVTKATFPTVAINVYNYDEAAGATNPAQPLGPPLHPDTDPDYKGKPLVIVKKVGDVNVGIIGITSDVVPQQAQAFNSGLRFTMGYNELPDAIAIARKKGAELIVVLSELGLAKNVQLVKEFPDIGVMFSGHTHERTPALNPDEIKITHSDGSFSLVTEAGEDSFLGRLTLDVSNGQILSYEWDLMEADSSVKEDEAVAEYVEEFRKSFVSGPDFQCHTFGTNAFPFGKGHTVCEPMDKVIGYTEKTIQRFDALEDISNNVMVDAFLDLAQNINELDSKNNPLTDANTLSTTNGFRFDIVVFGKNEELTDGSISDGRITVEDLYDYYPIGAAVSLAEFTGGRLKLHWEGILNNVFDPNPYRQRGGWFLGFTHNMHFDLQLNDDFPQSISAGKRITGLTIDGQKFDDSKTYTLASCYPHGNPVDEVCRTAGATNIRFIIGKQEKCEHPAVFAGGIENCQLDVSKVGKFQVVPPENSENIWDPVRFANGGPLFLKVAPDNFVHPVDALRRYLASNIVTEADHGLGRVQVVGADPNDPRRGVPESEFGGAGIVQPTQGVGPAWLKREFVVAP